MLEVSVLKTIEEIIQRYGSERVQILGHLDKRENFKEGRSYPGPSLPTVPVFTKLGPTNTM